MTGLIPILGRELGRAGFENLPATIGRAGESAAWRFIGFFAATIRNPNTRAAYAQAVAQFFAGCERHRIHSLEQVKPVVVAAYIEKHPGSAPTVKQHLAAIRMLFDFLAIGQIVPVNPAASVRGPKHVVRKGKTPVRTDQASQLLDSIETGSVVGLRDRAVIGLMCYTFARVSAMVRMRVETCYEDGKRGYASTRKAAAGTRCRATTMQSRILSLISMPPASVAKRNPRSSGAWTKNGGSRRTRWRGQMC